MIKIMHISDTHVKLLKQHKEYKIIFSKIYEILKEEKPDIIVHTGDLFHNKTNLSPEAISLTMDFLKNLADTAPTYILPGNHDVLLKNSNRMDAITPVVEALQHPNLHYLKKSQEVNVGNNICFNAFSMMDEDNWKKISDPNKINIALYHGSVSGVITDTGYVMEHGDHPIEIFEGFDYALLGDIHKTNQILDQEGRIRYAGSTISQNHGETNDKGFLIWEIEDKNTFNVRHISIPNPNPFITIELEPDGQLPEDIQIPENSKLRIVSNTHLSAQTLKKAADIAKTRFSPESITIHNRPGKRISVEELSNSFEEDNLRDIKIQESLLREYLKEYKLSQDIEQKIFDLNKKYNILAEQTEEVARNITWKLKSVEWSNLFNYGENNKINFEKLNGIIGLFGKNYSGKSSVIDSVLWTIFNSISKNVRKNVDIINQNKENCYGKVELVVDNKIYTIERRSEKYIKKLYGEETIEAKTTLDFSVYDSLTDTVSNLNGTDRNETDANIRKIFGTIEDFLLTSMTSQTGSLSYINEGSTKRKEILGKFLDLEMFDKKYKLSKDDSSLLKGAIKRLEGKDFDQEIEKVSIDIKINEDKTNQNKKSCEDIKKNLVFLDNERMSLKLKIGSGKTEELLDIESIKKSLGGNVISRELAVAKSEEISKEKVKKETTLLNINSVLEKYKYSELKDNNKKLKEFEDKYKKVSVEINSIKKDIENKTKSISILGTVPCGDSFPSCRFLQDANLNKNNLSKIENELENKQNESEEMKKVVDEYSPSISLLEKYEVLLKNKQVIEKDIVELSLKYEKNNSIIKNFEEIINTLESKKQNYYENENWMKELKELREKEKEIDDKCKNLSKTLSACEEDTLSLHSEHGSSIQKRITLENEKKELSNLRDEYLAYDLYSKATNSNGIVYDIIKKKLPIINQEILKVLTNIVEFDIFFEDDGKKLDIFIKHPKFDSRPLELCSGAEKAIAAIAIRLAMIKVTSLPVSDILVLDEPGTSLDEDNMTGFTKMLEMVKNQFKTVILISHLDALKDVVDDGIAIESSNGYAKIDM